MVPWGLTPQSHSLRTPRIPQRDSKATSSQASVAVAKVNGVDKVCSWGVVKVYVNLSRDSLQRLC